MSTPSRFASFVRALLPVALSLAAHSAFGANATVPGTLTTYVTIVSAGFEWRIAGDDNANCTCTLEYRKAGETAWRTGQPLWRVETGLWHHGEDPGDLLAGSLFFLEPATTYEARLTLADPDGGAAQQIVSVTTRAEPQLPAGARVRRVVPGTRGGDGSLGNPFRGLAAADSAAAPGDLFVLAPGTYTGTFRPAHDGTASLPITWLGTAAATTLLDAGGDSTTLDLTGRHDVQVWNVSLLDALYCVRVDATTRVTLRGCTVQPVNQLLSTRGVTGENAHDLVLEDNSVFMRGNWLGIGRTGAYGTGGYGIRVTGDGIVAAYNHVVEAWDGIDVGESDGTGARTFNADVYGNFVDRASDDACQTDAIHQNVRVFRNRFLNSGCATSCQPCFGGPCWILDNEMCNVRTDPFKYHQETSYFGAADPQETSGMIAAHNTVVCSKSAWYEAGVWHDVRHRDNLLLGERSGIYSLYVYSGTRGDLDWDGYNREQSTLAKYDNVGYATLPALAAGAGQEAHGLEVSLAEFVRAPVLPHPEWNWSDGYGTPLTTSDYDLQLAAGSVAIDRGTPLPGIDDGWTGAAPDLGCYERGAALPWYGPRAVSGVGVPLAAPAEAPGLRLFVASANPARGDVRIGLVAARGVPVRVAVLDLAGRVVRELTPVSAPPGLAVTLRWDGRDDAGRELPPGVYAVMASAGRARAVCRVVRLP